MMLTLLIVLGVILAIISLGLGTFWVLLQLGVIVNEASKPTYSDTNDYRLSQGREVGKEREG
jgi:sulfite exporter TauE/SafE